MPKIEPFEQYSNEYDAWFDENAEVYAAELETVRQLLPPAGAVGVEIGVGSGKFAGPLGVKLGVEPSPVMAAKAEKLGITVKPGVAEALPLDGGTYDFALMITTICFVDDILKSFQEAYRVLKLGGCLLVGLVDKESELGKVYQSIKEHDKFYRMATFFSTQEVLDVLKKAGFGKTEIRQTLIAGAEPGTIKEGFGEGAFIVVKAMKVE